MAGFNHYYLKSAILLPLKIALIDVIDFGDWICSYTRKSMTRVNIYSIGSRKSMAFKWVGKSYVRQIWRRLVSD